MSTNQNRDFDQSKVQSAEVVVLSPVPSTKTTKLAPIRSPEKHPLIYVEWEDHHSNGGWQELDAIDSDPLTAVSVGWLVCETEKTLVIAGSKAMFVDSYSSPFSNTTTILKSNILKRIKLRKPR